MYIYIYIYIHTYIYIYIYVRGRQAVALCGGPSLTHYDFPLQGISLYKGFPFVRDLQHTLTY